MMTEIRDQNSDFAKIILANIATADNCRREGCQNGVCIGNQFALSGISPSEATTRGRR